MKNTLFLNGSWQLSKKDDGSDIIIAQVPGEVHVDLHRAGKIPDPYYAMNAEDVRWVSRRQWWYKRSFDVDDEFLGKQTYLEFDGLDALATVFLNGNEIGCAENMFIPYRFDVSGVIELGQNVVEVRFDPPTFLDVRKMRLSFEHPKLMGMGVWRDVRLVSYDLASIKNVHIETEIEGAWANAWIYIEVENHTGEDLRVLASVVLSKGESREKIEVADCISPFGGVIETVIRIEEPELWWPNGVGEASLYNCMIGITCEDEVQDVTQTAFGVRDIRFIELDENPTILVNGEKVFCKGAKWMPTDLLASSMTDDRYRQLLRLAKDANINMLRVWDGGIYEDCAFYQMCDEMGIMLWQDFMFSDKFDDKQIAYEVESVVKRLRNHPSITAWGANSQSDTISNVLSKLDRARTLHNSEVFFKNDLDISGPPEIESLRQFISEDQLLAPDSEAMRYHSCQKSMVDLTREKMGDFTTPEQFAAYAGIYQGERLKAEIESRRCEKWKISSALLGFFNDSWPVIGSSLVDYYLRPKAAYYFAKRAFETVIVSFKQIEDRVQVFVTTDDRLHGIDGKLQIGVMTFDACGFDMQEVPVNLEPDSSAMIWVSEPLESIFEDTKRQCLVAMLEVRGEIIARNIYFARIWSEINFPLPKLLVHREQLSETTHELLISVDAYTRNLTISNLSALARPSDNYFDILPGEQKIITIQNITVEQANNLKLNVWGK